jgi:secondary thiamine-phosphate synthase enzyme
MSDWQQQEFEIRTGGRQMIEVTARIQEIVRGFGVVTGIAHLFLRHTSASLLLSENADSAVLRDLETILSRLAPDGDPAYEHDYEGDDDMAAHVRSVLTTNDISIPVGSGELMLGTWQGIYLWEHRYRPHKRRCVVTVCGQRG